MKKSLGAIWMAVVLVVCGVALATEENPMVILKTTKGDITVELFADKAPQTVRNFLSYVDSGHYRGTIFHRVIAGFMIQGGGLTSHMASKSTQAPIANEATNKVRNARGTLSMARTSEVNSATAQFFINLVDNPSLDHADTTPRGFGYCVFGRVIEGMDVVDTIGAVATGTRGHFQNVPLETVEIRDVVRKAPKK